MSIDQPIWPSYPLAAQPDVILGEKRDGYYLESLRDGLKEVCECSIGLRRTQILSPELNLISSFLYYGLSTLFRRQTIGQEYCELIFENNGSADVSSSRLLSYSICEGILPYIVDRFQNGWISVREIFDPFNRQAEAARIREAMQLRAMQDSNIQANEISTIETSRWKNLWLFISANRKKIASLLKFVITFHLMLYYLNGKYHSIAMRLLRLRHQYNRSSESKIPNYRVLGMIMLLQMCVQGFSKGVGYLNQFRAVSDVDKKDTEVRVPSGKTREKECMSRCALCMSSINHPSATPCGHLFCWDCIINWCESNPECPLCRQPAEPQSIVCLNNYC